MKYRIVKEKGKYKIQYKFWGIFWFDLAFKVVRFSNSFSGIGGSSYISKCSYIFKTKEEANKLLNRYINLKTRCIKGITFYEMFSDDLKYIHLLRYKYGINPQFDTVKIYKTITL